MRIFITEVNQSSSVEWYTLITHRVCFFFTNENLYIESLHLLHWKIYFEFNKPVYTGNVKNIPEGAINMAINADIIPNLELLKYVSETKSYSGDQVKKTAMGEEYSTDGGRVQVHTGI